MRILDINLKKTTWRFSISIGKKWPHEHLIFGIEHQNYNNKTRRKFINYLTFGRLYVMFYYVRFIPGSKNGFLEKKVDIRRGEG